MEILRQLGISVPSPLPLSTLVDVLTLAVSIIGAILIWRQLRVTANTSKAALILSMNRDLNEYADMAVAIENARIPKMIEDLDARQKEKMLDYLTLF